MNKTGKGSKDYFEFDDSNRTIRIKRPDTPQPWINYLSNGRFHSFISQAGGGFAWWQSPVVMRLTRYRQYNLPIDSPGFYIYIRHPDGTVWSPAFRPSETPLDKWEASHMPGISCFKAEKNGVKAELQYFVAPDYDVLIWDLKLINSNEDDIDLDVFAYVEHSQLNWETESSWGYYIKLELKTWFDNKLEAQNYLCHASNVRGGELPLVYLASSEKIKSYSGSRNDFIGNYRSERNPIAIENGCCGNEELGCGEPASALHTKIRLGREDSKRTQFFLGVAPGALVDLNNAVEEQTRTLDALRTPGEVDRQREKLNAWWKEHFAAYQCEVPDPVVRRQINTWNVVNSVQTGRYSRAVNTAASGIRGIGFRDSSQDMLAVAYRNPQWAMKVLEYLLSQQYRDGHVVHYAYPEEKKMPNISRHSDDHLWPPLVVYAILAETGNFSFLEKNVPYLAKDHIARDGEGSVWEHIMKAIDYTKNNLGKHGLPLTMRSDWNDIIGRFNQRGEGETVFAGQQYVLALRQLIEIAEAAGKNEINWLKNILNHQISALEQYAWDGQWWRRGFDDDGNPVGSSNCNCGQLFLNPQSWAVISQVGARDQWRSGMDSVKQMLDTGIGLKILAPSFPTWANENGPTTGYGPGCGENGAIFCHANTWAIIAEALLGNAERAWQYFTQLIPENVIKLMGIERYRAEPYAWVSNIVGPDNNRFGWANVEQITGTAPWMDIASTQYLLGVRPTMKGLLIDPCVPPDWKDFSIKRRYRGCRLDIHILNPDKTCKGIGSIKIDNKYLDITGGPVIPPTVLEGKKSANVKVVMGT
jgi:cellobiose phosphorylase